MAIQKIKGKDEIGFYALGGLGEVGKNMYVFDIKEQLFIVDAGILFPDEHLLGVDYVIPDFQYLMENQERIVGLFITHGHEDHIGGIPFLLKKVKIPKIYAAGVAIDLIMNKLSDYKDIKVPQIIEFKNNTKLKFIGVDISFIRLNHSIPDSYGIVFKTQHGNLFHTGDFKFDFTPVGPGCEFDMLASLGEEGVLALFADSTNACVEGFTKSEKVVGKSIKDLFAHIDSRIIVATFASNMYRVQQIIEASYLNNRKVAVFGRSMEKTIEVGQQVGYISAPAGTIIDASEINNYKLNEITLLVTGSQGEPLAALSRLANGSHRQIKLVPGDTIIFSSSPIPGNQEGVNKTINLLFKNGANVIVNSPINDTHTSGHASQGDLKLMQSLLKPKFFIPVHGEYRMQKVHTELAIECGCKPENTFVLENGDVLAITENSARRSGHVQSGDVYIDGTRIGDIDNTIIRERKMLSEDGLFFVIFTLSKSYEILVEPQVVSRGFIYMKDSEELTKYFIDKAREYLLSLLNTSNPNLNNIKLSLTEYLTKIIKEKTDRKPIVLPVFMIVNC
ncbi:MAG: ribonuclease J [Anaeroplasmataceae bacterium]